MPLSLDRPLLLSRGGIADARLLGRRFEAQRFDALEEDRVGVPRTTGRSRVVMLSLLGMLGYRASYFGTGLRAFGRAFSQAIADDDVRAVVLEIDSPGGPLDGVPELADLIYNARGSKPITAIANAQAVSAAYWIGTSADKLFVTPSGVVGSVGVFAMHSDRSKFYEGEGIRHTLIHAGKYKVEGNPYEPLGDEARDAIQADVDAYHKMFVDAVARNRGVSTTRVRARYGQGREVMAGPAKAANMVDGIRTLDDVLAQEVARLKRQG